MMKMDFAKPFRSLISIMGRSQGASQVTQTITSNESSAHPPRKSQLDELEATAFSRNMFKKAAILLLHVIVFTHLASGEELEDRVDSLEQKMDRIIQLLEASNSPAEKGDSTKPAKKQKTQLQNGARFSAYLITRESYQTPQTGEAIETGIDQGDSFKVGNYLASPSSKTFTDHLVGVAWKGYLWIEEPGKYMFTGQKEYAFASAIAKVFVNGQSLLTSTSKDSAPALGQITFESAGMYEFEVWVAPGSTARGAHIKTAFSLQLRKQGASKFEKLTPGTLYSEK